MHGDWNTYLNELHQYMKKQEQMIVDLEKRLYDLEAANKQANSTTIEKIEYNFDQLKIERLDGTLHIGLSPNDLANIEDLGLPMNQASSPSQVPPPHQKLHAELSHYLQQNGAEFIRKFAAQHNRSIDHKYETVLIQDITKQLPERIAYYEEKALQENQNISDEHLYHYISNQIKHEIQQSLTKYMKNE
ncbi:spore germination protein GerPC [Virgibacillus sp. SK37]|uniref:spore germination protein GerPC n=1 Tax=Virgibacillus sp. SK37 TaxID=403957 RepID=UPI0004D0EDBC|nr:spore germination protein GerPC [Virgibacillus sp. SK37]AIF45219.1 hypothetical protein X953_05345 [Virgibacillus sp. SK37]